MRLTELTRLDSPTPATFHEEFVRHRRPVVLTNVLEHRTRWTPEFFADSFPDTKVQVESWKRFDKTDDPGKNDFYRTRVKVRMTMREYVERVRSARADDESFLYLADYPVFARHKSLAGESGQLAAYMQSRIPWLLQRPFQDPQLMYFGPPGAVSIMHFDTPNNLLAQLYGRKSVILFSPEESANLYSPSDDFIGHFSPVDVERPDYARFPRLADAQGFTTILEPGDILFIPSRWWHHIRSLEVSISLNAFWVSLDYFRATAYVAYIRSRQMVRRRLRSLKTP